MTELSVVKRKVKRAERTTIEALGRYGVATVHEAMGRVGLMKPYMRPIYPGALVSGTRRSPRRTERRATRRRRSGTKPKARTERSPHAGTTPRRGDLKPWTAAHGGTALSRPGRYQSGRSARGHPVLLDVHLRSASTPLPTRSPHANYALNIDRCFGRGQSVRLILVL
jgi:hypothetical protein